MSTVYLSYDVALGRPVAIKLLADHLAQSPEFVQRFYREARLSRLLSHPNLVQGLGAGFDPDAGKHYLVLEFIEGPSAHAALVAYGRFPVGVAVKVGIDIGHDLQFLHSRQYVHRDVKPDNVLLDTGGVAKLADLGLAKRLNDDQQLTTAAQGVGTSYYMAYEQAVNSHLVDGRSDIFALGATLYHLLTGGVPFPGATHAEVMRVKEHAAFVPVLTCDPRIPPSLAKVIETTLARDPRGRYQCVGELVRALEVTGLATAIPSLGGDPNTPSNPTRIDLGGSAGAPKPGPTATPVSAVAVPAPPPESWNLRRRVFRVVLALVAATLATGLALGARAAWTASARPPEPQAVTEEDVGPPPPTGLTPAHPQ